jgi:DNA-binding Lrp family transcriptional regulator
MPKISEKQIEIDETKVIEQLRENSNKSINEIAEKLGFSRQKVWRIVKRLEKENIIWGYGAVIDEGKLGLNYYILLLKKNVKPVESFAIKNITGREIEAHIRKMGCDMVTSLYTHGFYDWIILFTAPNTIVAKKVSELFLDRYHEFLSDIKLLETIFPVKVKGKVNPNVQKLKDLF